MAATGRLFFEIGGSASQLLAELEKVRNKFEETGTRISRAGLQQVATFQNIINPAKELARNFELLEKAGKALGDSSFNVTNFVKANEKAIRDAITASGKFGTAIPDSFKKYADELKRLDGEQKKTGIGIEKLGQTMTDFARNPIQTAQNQMIGFMETLGPTAVGIVGIATAAAVAGAAILKMGVDATEAAKQIQNMSYQTGMTVEDVQALERLGKEAGVGDLARKIELLNIQLGKGQGGDFTKAILQMNIAVKESGGAIYYLEEMRKKLAQIPDETKRAEEGAAALGRRLWHDLAPLLMNTSESITESMAKIQESGAVMTRSQIDNLLKLHEKIDEHGRAWERLKHGLDVVTGAITLSFVEWTESMVQNYEKWKGAFPILSTFIDLIRKLADEQEKASGRAPLQMMSAHGPQADLVNQAADAAKKQTDELQRRADVIAKQDAIASGERGKLLDLSIKLKQVEEERQRIAKDATGLRFEEQRRQALSEEAASIKRSIEAIKAKDAELNKATGEQLKWLQEQMRGEQKVKDQVAFYADEVEKAASAWAKNVAELKRMDPLMDAASNWAKSWLAVAQMKPRPLFEEAPLGQTFEDFKNNLPKINQEIDTFVTKNEKASQSIADVWRNQVSTIVTDWGRGIADILIEGGDFGKKLTDIFKETAKSILRMLIEQLFNPLKDLLNRLVNSIFSAIKSAITGGSAGTTAAGAGIGGLATGWAGAAGGAAAIGGALLAGTGWNKPGIGGWAQTVGGAAATGAGIGTMILPGVGTVVGGFIGMWAGLFGRAIKQWLGKNAQEAGAIEAGRDFGVKISENVFKGFYQSVGLTESKAYGIRKDLTTSPLFVSQILVPAAQSQGRLDVLLKNLEKVSVDTRIAASGFLNFRSVVEEGIKTGNWDAFNKAWEAAFKNSTALTAVMPDLTALLVDAGDAASTAADATDDLATGFLGLRDAISQSLPSAKDMYQVFWETGEILPELSDLIVKYGGNLSVWQKAADLPGLRANLASIGDLTQGLLQILPDLDPIQKLLSGEGVDWEGFLGMGLDPSKLVKIGDLIKYTKELPGEIADFTKTGKLVKGGVLEQGLWQFGGEAGMTALNNYYNRGFNTITPALMQTVLTGANAAYKAERTSVLPYLQTMSTGIQDKIDGIGKAIVDDLDKILWAIQNPGKPLPESLGGPKAEGISAPLSPTPATSAPGYTSPGMPGERPPVYIDMRGATVYGYEDFEGKVQLAWSTGYRRGSYGFAFQ